MTHENLHAASATRHCFYLADIALFIGLAGSSMKSDGALTSNAAIQLYLGLRDAGAQVEHIRHIWPHASPSSARNRLRPLARPSCCVHVLRRDQPNPSHSAQSMGHILA